MYKDILILIGAAQMASDAGKSIFCEELYGLMPKHIAERAVYNGYHAKDKFIVEAMKLVCQTHEPNIRFYVGDGDGLANAHIVYFDIKTQSGRVQVSFHTFASVKKTLAPFMKSTSKSRWTGRTKAGNNANGKGSRVSICEALKDAGFNVSSRKEDLQCLEIKFAEIC